MQNESEGKKITEFEISLPECARHPPPENVIKTRGPIVIVGANGSGKSRLAEWIEKSDPAKRHRVSAQRALAFPEDFRATSVDEAESDLLYGGKGVNWSNKFGFRWTPNRHDQLLNDFQKLVTLLFSEGAQAREEYVHRMKSQTVYETPPVRKLDTIQRIWEEILPNRELIIGGNQVEVRRRDEAEKFSPREMSDGERVVFYLIGQCLSAPKGGIILIDEPELHLHRALQTRLWDSVETERSDCLFIYLTHDLDFAGSRMGGLHIWLTEYGAGDKWEWDFVPEGTALPEALLLEVIGSRKPILFVEGKAEGPDERLYRLIYPTQHIVPFAGCAQIIHAVSTCRNLRRRGQLQVETRGLIDRDGRDKNEVQKLNDIGVGVLDWAEIENLLICEEVLRHVASALHLDVNDVIKCAKDRVFALITEHTERIAAELAGRDLDRKIREWPWKYPSATMLERSLTDHLATIDAAATVSARRKLVEDIVAKGDYEDALKVYPNKGVIAEIGQIVGLRDYTDYVLRRLATKEGEPLLSSLKVLLPSLPS